MTDEYEKKTADSYEQDSGESRNPAENRDKRNANGDQPGQEANDATPSTKSDADDAQREQDRQLETGEESPV